jgi:hypothetical protein
MSWRSASGPTRPAASRSVFVHGLWLLPSSWDRWAALFEKHGYVALTPGGRPLRHHLLVPKVALAGMAD